MTAFYATGTAATGMGATGTASTVPAPDTDAPILSSPSGTSTGTTSAIGSVSTNEATGTLFSIATPNANESAAVVKAGSSKSVTAAGVQTVGFVSLSPDTVYFPHYLHRDLAGNESLVSNGISFRTNAVADTTGPVLSAPTGSAAGSNAANGSVTTDEGNGTLFAMISTNAVESGPTVMTSALHQTVTSAGVKTFNTTGLTPDTIYYWHFVQPDAAGNASNVVNSASFKTDALSAVLVSRTVYFQITDQNGPCPNLTGIKFAFYDGPTPDLYGVVRKQSAVGTTDANGYMTFTVLTALGSGGIGGMSVQLADGRNFCYSPTVS